MKSKVIVTLKEGVLDPQGQTIQRALSQLGHADITSVRQGKYFELEFAAGTDDAEIERVTDEVARRVLSNPIIERYQVESPS